MRPSTRFPVLGALLAPLLLASGCGHPDQSFESVLQYVRRNDVEKDDKGDTEQVDFEMEWDACPGDQFQYIRGGKEFAKCMERYEPGDYVSVLVKHTWDEMGFYRWDIYKVGACDRAIEKRSPGSFEKSQECSEVKMYGKPAGFTCLRRPEKELVATCPWMARK
jgi:hypothetical protein